ncbi:hypothetical protein CANCADRAFT_3841 [Tortispora caseinolytica NRRL Y-17796]|uniref:Uncharacterized protein n=1 Tax=Tortispora caseinolytica NRRL Y-17796 TaxID=767744 RepID=A0A1E4TC37_9ASCO|nr:hypothetical protein CANCADRAFT_3841 [Tortispora caseinolytica NRRL Y-17796]
MAHSASRDLFPLLELKELIACLDGCNISMTEEAIARPNQNTVTALWKQVAFAFTSMQEDISFEALIASANKVYGPDYDGPEGPQYVEDMLSRQEKLLLVRAIYRLLKSCGVDDFALRDIVQPEFTRLRRQLSAVVNYARYRESRFSECGEKINEADNILAELGELDKENQQLREEIESSRVQHLIDLQSSEKVSARNTELELELVNLKKVQEGLAVEYQEHRNNRAQLTESLKKSEAEIATLSSEVQLLMKYAKSAEPDLAGSNEAMEQTINEVKTQVQNMENKMRALTATLDMLLDIENDVKTAIRFLEECNVESEKERRVMVQRAELIEKMERLKAEVNDSQHSVNRIERQLQAIAEKVTRVNEQRAQQKQEVDERRRILYEESAKLSADRSVRSSELSKLVDSAENREQFIATQKRLVDNEIRKFEEDSEKLAHWTSDFIKRVGQQLTV